MSYVASMYVTSQNVFCAFQGRRILSIGIMGHVESLIVSDYGETSLGERILSKLQAYGVDTDHLTQEILAEIDHIHGGGYQNTIEHTQLVQLDPEMTVLDIGCGIGGPARYFANALGCRVIGIDLTEEYISVATMLTERCGLERLVEFKCANAANMPFGDASFDVAFCLNVTMNIEDRTGFYTEAARVLKPGGQLALSELGQGTGGKPYYPLPWARDSSYSFLVPPEELRAGLESAGFEITDWIDEAQRRKESAGRVSSGTSILPEEEAMKIVRGDDYGERRANTAKSVMEDRLTNVRLVAKLTR